MHRSRTEVYPFLVDLTFRWSLKIYLPSPESQGYLGSRHDPWAFDFYQSWSESDLLFDDIIIAIAIPTLLIVILISRGCFYYTFVSQLPILPVKQAPVPVQHVKPPFENNICPYSSA
jgi:hypothetical protein